MAYQTVTMSPMDSPPAPACADRRALPPAAVVDRLRMGDGWEIRRFRLPHVAARARRGALLFIGGRADFVEKYLESLCHWAGQGWDVTAFDWRGQGLSGRMLPQANTGHIASFEGWLDDLSAIAAAWRGEAPEGPHVVIAHSMGGHLLLRGLIEARLTADAAIFLAPMFGLNGGLVPARMGEAIATLACATGHATRPAWPSRPPSLRRMLRLTHDAGRYADEIWWREHCPDLALGPPSWRWLQLAYRSCRGLASDPRLRGMRVPSLILGTVADQLVLAAATSRIAARLPDVRLHLYGGEAAHELLREVDAVRQDALARIDAFLEEAAPAA